jgi:predicted nucleic acid-binding protein
VQTKDVCEHCGMPYMKIYLDNCCFNRPFDDQTQIRIKIETEAKLKIQEEIRSGKFQLIWSYILDYENSRNPYIERKIRIEALKKYAIEDIEENENILKIADIFNKIGIKKLDSLHLSCAVYANGHYFLTTDDGILRCKNQIEQIKIDDPIGFIKEYFS